MVSQDGVWFHIFTGVITWITVSLATQAFLRWLKARRAKKHPPDLRWGRPLLPSSDSEVPLLGFKGACIILDGASPFCALTRNARYGVDADARCVAGIKALHGQTHGHETAPHEHCGCGFYAFRSGDAQSLLTVPFVLEVELSGTVIVHSHGYRAEHQRVLHVWLGLCAGCARRRATVVARTFKPDVATVGGQRVVLSRRGPNELHPLCPTCAESDEVETMQPVELALRLGVPVSDGVPSAA